MPVHLRPCEVPIPIIDGFELRPIDRHAGDCRQTDLTIKLDELCAGLVECFAIVLAKFGDCLAVRHKPPQ